MLRIVGHAVALAVLWGGPAASQEVRITPDLPELRLTLQGEEIVISRLQDGEAVLEGEAALVARPCPPHCIQPMRVAAGVEPLGALEVIWFLQAEVASGAGYLLDVRMPAAFAAQRLPGAVNVPGVTLAPENPALRDILIALGGREVGGGLDFAEAPVLAVYGSGPVDDSAAQAVRYLLAAGYPADKLRYFRGGLQEWLQFALTTTGAAE